MPSRSMPSHERPPTVPSTWVRPTKTSCTHLTAREWYKSCRYAGLLCMSVWYLSILSSSIDSIVWYLSSNSTPSGLYSALHCLADTSSKSNTWKKKIRIVEAKELSPGGRLTSPNLKFELYSRIFPRQSKSFHLEDAWPLLSLSSAPPSHHQLLSSVTRICQAYWPECHLINLCQFFTLQIQFSDWNISEQRCLQTWVCFDKCKAWFVLSCMSPVWVVCISGVGLSEKVRTPKRHCVGTVVLNCYSIISAHSKWGKGNNATITLWWSKSMSLVALHPQSIDCQTTL